MKFGEPINCIACNKTTPRRGAMQKYCPECSDNQDLTRRRGAAARDRSQSAIIARGIELSKASARQSLLEKAPFVADDGWMVAFKIPYSPAASKNFTWSLAAQHGGHVFKRQMARQYQDAVALKVKAAVKEFEVFENKIWIELFVQKPSHKADAINVVDSICDGIKVGLGLDDRWFCIRQLDWEIAKHNPQIHISIYQRDAFHVRACSHCGRLLALDNFGKKKGARLGVDRVCRECRNAKDLAPGEGVTVRIEPAGVE